MPYLAIRSVLLNIRTSIREEHKIQDIDVSHFSSYIMDSSTCVCDLCTAMIDS